MYVCMSDSPNQVCMSETPEQACTSETPEQVCMSVSNLQSLLVSGGVKVLIKSIQKLMFNSLFFEL